MTVGSLAVSVGVSLSIAERPAQHRVLVVDDSTTVVRILTHLLKEEGYEVVTATDGEEGLALVRELRPAVVIVDTVMPRRNGYELCQAIRSDSGLAPPPYLLMLTSGGQETDRELALKAGADEFMTKPFSPSRLRARLRQVLDG